jgi:hypothetical protein
MSDYNRFLIEMSYTELKSSDSLLKLIIAKNAFWLFGLFD